MAYIIGDTIRLEATIKDLDGDDFAPAAITVSVYREDGTTKLLDAGVATKKTGRVADYYYDWQIPTSITKEETLTAVWDWSGPHKKKKTFDVEPAP